MKVDAKIRNDSDKLGVLSLVGPRAGQLMTRISDAKVGSFFLHIIFPTHHLSFTSFFLHFALCLICPGHLLS